MNRKTLLGDPPSIRITHRDLQRLERLLSGCRHLPSPVAEFLQRELDRADLVDGDAGSAFVALGTRLTFADERDNRHTGTLVSPDRLSDTPDGISVLTPVGSALLGLSQGQAIAYRTPDGRTKTLTVLHIHPA